MRKKNVERECVRNPRSTNNKWSKRGGKVSVGSEGPVRNGDRRAMQKSRGIERPAEFGMEQGFGGSELIGVVSSVSGGESRETS